MGDLSDDFVAKYGEAAYDLIWQRAGGDIDDPSVSISDVVTHNACNHTYYGHITIAGEEIAFELESGDRNGTVLRSYGDKVKVDRSFLRWSFCPKTPDIVARADETWAAFDARFTQARTVRALKFATMRKQPWFIEMERALNYDRRFAPGVVTDAHYLAFADQHGLGIVCERIDPDASVQAA